LQGSFYTAFYSQINFLSWLTYQKGFSTYKLRQQKLFGERTIQKIRNGEIVTAENLALICKLLNCQPGDIMEHVEEQENKE
jgi:putative transcriptional regulator